MLEFELREMGKEIKELGKKIIRYESGVDLVKRLKSTHGVDSPKDFIFLFTDFINLGARYGLTIGGVFHVLPYAIQGRYEEALLELVIIETQKLFTHGVCSAVRYGVNKTNYFDGSPKIEDETSTDEQ